MSVRGVLEGTQGVTVQASNVSTTRVKLCSGHGYRKGNECGFAMAEEEAGDGITKELCVGQHASVQGAPPATRETAQQSSVSTILVSQEALSEQGTIIATIEEGQEYVVRVARARHMDLATVATLGTDVNTILAFPTGDSGPEQTSVTVKVILASTGQPVRVCLAVGDATTDTLATDVSMIRARLRSELVRITTTAMVDST